MVRELLLCQTEDQRRIPPSCRVGRCGAPNQHFRRIAAAARHACSARREPIAINRLIQINASGRTRLLNDIAPPAHREFDEPALTFPTSLRGDNDCAIRFGLTRLPAPRLMGGNRCQHAPAAAACRNLLREHMDAVAAEDPLAGTSTCSVLGHDLAQMVAWPLVRSGTQFVTSAQTVGYPAR